MFINKLIKESHRKNSYQQQWKSVKKLSFVKDAAKIIFKCVEKKTKNIIYVGGEKISIKNILLLMKRNKFIKDLTLEMT